ncbi:MAG TPA: GerMN domain-containing protein [Acidimicrobiia bacterium]|jgi:spore germination protein GerM
MRLRRPLGLVLVAAGLLLAAAACSAPIDSGPRTLRAAAIPADLRGETTTTSTTVLSTGDSEEVTVYFIRADASTGQDRLVPVKRRVTPPASVEKAVQKLFAGPTTQELLSGLRTAISFGPTVMSASIEAHIVTVNVSKNFAFGQPTEQINAFAQVVFTATDVAGVTGVLFAVNHRPQEVPSGDGSSTSAPLGRGSYPQVTPR